MPCLQADVDPFRPPLKPRWRTFDFEHVTVSSIRTMERLRSITQKRCILHPGEVILIGLSPLGLVNDDRYDMRCV